MTTISGLSVRPYTRERMGKREQALVACRGVNKGHVPESLPYGKKREWMLYMRPQVWCSTPPTLPFEDATGITW